MSSINEIVNNLEIKINQLLRLNANLNEKNKQLNLALAQSAKLLHEKEALIAQWQDNYQALQIANTMLGSDNNKRETKLKINSLIRDIDACIAQLSE